MVSEMTSRASTPDYSPRLSPKQEFRRMGARAPQDYPCYTENGYYQNRCEAARRSAASDRASCDAGGRGLTKVVGNHRCPYGLWRTISRCQSQNLATHTAQDPTVLLKDYDPTTGWTPLHAEGWQVANARFNAGETYLNVWWKVNGWRRTTMPPEVM